jgi:hypothetical protein
LAWLKEGVERRTKSSRIKRDMTYIKKIERGLSTTPKWGIFNDKKRGR